MSPLILQRSPTFCPVRTLASSARSSPHSAIFNAHRLTRIGFVSGAVFVSSLFYGNTQPTVHADAEPAKESDNVYERPRTPLSTLVRTYIVYGMCSIPPLIDYSSAILATLLSIPGIKQITEVVVRVTFFNQFVGGETAEEVIPLLEQMRSDNKGCLFAYSVEVDEEEAAGDVREDIKPAESAHKQIVAETIHCVDVAADFEDKHANGISGRRTWVAVKLASALSESLLNLSKHLVATRPLTSPHVAFPGCPLPTDLDVLDAQAPLGPLTPGDVAALRELRADLHAICSRAKERGVRIIIDAEYRYPAVDALCLDLMREFNKLPQPSKKSRSSWFGSSAVPTASPVQPAVQPLIYNTYQAYLRRTPEYLVQSIAAARAGGYALGVKLVRGAYHPHEISAHTAAETPSSTEHSHSLSISPEAFPPVWLTKPETDACFNSCTTQLIDHIRADVSAHRAGTLTIGVLLGTHNQESTNLVLCELVKQGLASEEAGVVRIPDEVAERISLGQLYGMHDSLTNHLVDRTRCSSPFVLKYIPYGNISDVMPYLSRRAIENKSVLGNGVAAIERQRAATEIWDRFFG
ncbi:Proline dehydrogenase 1, mitochondrial [Grifola frondosa]|uniref:Proline dehydrogenase n=1 Tax=Grifola frondosa TaxID=5627 RepID=A0A1C7MNV2_GRIFR|nr:Proline dehydrogenase 1, mitochondrial [Grifola frondosa]